MSKVDKQALRELAEKAGAKQWSWWTSCSFLRLTFAEERDGGAMSAFVCADGVASIDCSEGVQEFIEAANPATVLALLDEIEWLKADAAATREAFSQCVDSLHAEMLGKYHGQSPEDMHPVVRRDYDQDVLEVKEYREIAEPDGCQGGADRGR